MWKRVLTRNCGHFATLPGKVKPARAEERTAEQRAATRWEQRVKRVFKVDVETCPNCGGSVKVIACIEDPPVIEQILTHLASPARFSLNFPGSGKQDQSQI